MDTHPLEETNQLVDVASWQNWTDEEIVEILLEHYYTLGSTGEEAVLAVLHDTVSNRFTEYHLIDNERMSRIFMQFAHELKDCMQISAMDFYRSQQNDKV